MTQHHREHATHHGKLILDTDVRLCAYLKWQAVGKPAGDGISFWLAAEQELVAGENEKFVQRDGWDEHHQHERLQAEKKVSEDGYYRDNNRMFQNHGDRGHRHGSR